MGRTQGWWQLLVVRTKLYRHAARTDEFFGVVFQLLIIRHNEAFLHSKLRVWLFWVSPFYEPTCSPHPFRPADNLIYSG